VRLKPDRREDDAFDEPKVSRMDGEHQSGPGTESEASLAALQQRNQELEVLYSTIRDLTSTLAVHEVIERLLDRTLLHLDAEIGSILVLDGDGTLRIVHSCGLPSSVVEDARVGPGEGISGYVLETARPLLVSDIETDDRFHRRNHERYYTHSCISAPLLIEGEARGVVNVNNRSDRQAFGPGNLALLEGIAGHAAIALSNARRYEEMLERARRDPLTGLANHGHFWASLDVEVRRSDRHARPLSVVLIDIDHFKAFNDRHGHLEGDKALMAVGKGIECCSRVHDVVARYGGEEFAVVLPEASRAGAVAFAEKIREMVESLEFAGEDRPAITISAGVACFGEDGTTARELVQAADRQLYRAKDRGRNRVHSSDGED
jgi:diguanylate cyclase (GGDEF)-like protein